MRIEKPAELAALLLAGQGWTPERIQAAVATGQQVVVTLAEYERVRTAPTHFIIKEGHELEDVERVVTRTDRFVVVQKKEGEAAIARETDPRR